jgi:CrcB protein
VAQILLVSLGAGLGGMLRHAVGLSAARRFGTGYPFGTLIVNVLGSFVMGLVTGLLVAHPGLAAHWRLPLGTGLLGGFTTFSTFALDAGVMIERRARGRALGYVALSVVASIAAVALGLALGG